MMLALPLLLLGSFAPDNATQALHRTAEAYENLSSFEITASLSFRIPGQGVTVTSTQIAYFADASMLPPGAPVPVLQVFTAGGAPIYRDSSGKQVRPDVASGLSMSLLAFPFNSLNVVDGGLVSARILPDEMLMADNSPISCSVIEAVYDRRSEFGRGKPMRLWIDKSTRLVRQARYAGEWRPGQFAEVTARVVRMSLNEPPPKAALDSMAHMVRPPSAQENRWIGQPARDFAMNSLRGETITLAGLRGKVIVLDFWATWCGPCNEEMRLLEKLRDELTSQGVEIWGITDEQPDIARRWMADRDRRLPTLIDSGRALFGHYEVEAIPVLMIIRPDGAISSFTVGLRGERGLRADIAKAMR